MATTISTPTTAFSEAARFGEIRSRLLFLIGALIVYRIGTFIPVPGVNPAEVAKFFGDRSNTILGIVNMFSGGALSRLSIFAMGVMPYISASIIIQMMSMVVPSLTELRKEGESGRRKITEYTRYGTVVLAAFQSFAAAGALVKGGLTLISGWQFLFVATVTMTTGTLFLMWLGEQITERGLGNGISIIIFGGIAAGFPNAVGGLFELVRTGSMSIISAIIIVVLIAAVTYLVVFIERGQRKILVNYAKRQVGNKIYGGQSSHLPLKLNMSGVIPPIFASSIILFPATILGWFSTGQPTGSWISNTLHNVAEALKPGQPVYVLLYTLAIVFFCFFYTALVFNSRETADNLKKSGAFVPGIRPGDQTARYIDRILTRLTLAGAIYIVFVCLLPEFLVLRWNVPFYFGGTSLLIIVVVTMDFMAQVQSYVMSQQYESLLKKANFKGGNIPMR